MPKKSPPVAAIPPDRFFEKELSGENPPSFAEMTELYRQAAKLFGLKPWSLLQENQLILIPHPEKDELCYCSVMGAMGEVFSMHAYIGTKGYRSFHQVATGKLKDPAEYLISLNCVYVEFVSRAESEGPDKKALDALGHPKGKTAMAPIFRAIRPGFHPWFVTSEESRILAACIRAVIVVCSEIARNGKANFWPRADTFPLVMPGEDAEHPYRIELMKLDPPAEEPLPLAQIPEEALSLLRKQDYRIQGVTELDYVLSTTAVGKKSERKACTCVTLAVDADSGIIYASELSNGPVLIGDELAKALMKAVQGTRTLPREIHVRSRKVKECLRPLVESFSLSISISDRLPALEEARAHLLSFLKNG